MAISFIDMDKCSGCGMCELYCPVDVIYFDRTLRKPVVKYPDDCMVCGLCEDRCVLKAITVDPNKTASILLSWK